jgi:hypothetical protein
MMETSYVASWQSDDDVEGLESLEDSSLVERSLIDVVTKFDNGRCWCCAVDKPSRLD